MHIKPRKKSVAPGLLTSTCQQPAAVPLKGHSRKSEGEPSSHGKTSLLAEACHGEMTGQETPQPLSQPLLRLSHGLPWVRVLLPRVQAPEGAAGAFPGPLSVQGHDGQGRRLDVGDQGRAAVDGCSSQGEAVSECLRIHGVRHVDDEIKLAALEQCRSIGLALHERLVDQDDRVHATLQLQELGGVLGRIDLEAHAQQHLRILQELDLLLRGTYAEEDGLGGQFEAGGDHRFQEGLVLVDTEARNLSRRLHLHPQPRVRVLEAAKREDWNLGSNAIHVDRLDGHHLLRNTKHDASGQLNKVDVVRLRDEREGARRPEVTLDHHHLVLLAHELHVEWTGDAQRAADLLADHLDSPVRLDKQLLRWQQQRGIAAMHTGVLHVLGDGIVQQLAVLADSVEFNLFCSRDVLRYDHRVVAAHHGSCPEEAFQL
mmetsp:Transcript_71242/g.189439  ORF Transcript_71242/g.189439 Transcript_71242/m.189439 type:complete len:428 (-) Transcript_71242:43-1326(-)